MKKLLTLAFVLATTLLFGQTEKYKKYYLDSLGFETAVKDHKYYRIIKDYHLKKNEYEVTDYYLGGRIKTERTYSSKFHHSPIGSEKEYYPSGQLKNHRNYNLNSELYGPYISFYENGKKEIEGEVIKIKIDSVKEHQVLKIVSYWDENGTQKVFEGKGFMIEKDVNNIESSRGKLENGLKTGIWTGFNSKYKLQFADQYESGIFMGGMSKDGNGNENAYVNIERQPEFKGGKEAYVNFVQKKFRIPEVDRDIKGRIYIKFNVNPDGNVSDAEIIRDLDEKLSKEAIRFVYSTSGLWTPGEYRGFKVKANFTLPIAIDVDVVNKSRLN
ncbi:hypothetical protein EQG63_01705 [Flavobacterium amnicola]|uniref:TonB C-terminal domain-containing protein n=1 Tax=Flavobacterium amnicola TaxID=2506422 RepID=A0A4Q1K665_9FLAO|nr:energy transducer TonB [Flavobacterium amnicola]RXR20674.1 hypothetical protein EQG63_01705 [Flavobacterium amnicola]